MPLKWCASYLKGRKQSVVIGNTISKPKSIDCSVPQGSVAGPFMFTIYASPLESVIKSFGVDCMIYADDTQLYLLLDPSTRDTQLHRLEECIRGVKSWTAENKLLLNDAKTEVLHISSRFIRAPNPITSVCIDESPVATCKQVRNLGAIMDQHMTSLSHVSRVCQSASLAIAKIGGIRKYIDRTTAERLVHAFVTSRLDSNNSLMYGIPNSSIVKLQRVQNSAVRLVLGVKGYQINVNNLRRTQLHWLPITDRIVFKILLLTFNVSMAWLPPTSRTFSSDINPVALFVQPLNVF